MKVFEGKLLAKGLRFGIIVSRFNDFIGERLLAAPSMLSRGAGLTRKASTSSRSPERSKYR